MDEYVCVHACMYMYLYICIFVYMYLSTCIHACMHKCLCPSISDQADPGGGGSWDQESLPPFFGDRKLPKGGKNISSVPVNAHFSS